MPFRSPTFPLRARCRRFSGVGENFSIWFQQPKSERRTRTLKFINLWEKFLDAHFFLLLLLGNKLHIFIMSLGWIATVQKWCRQHASVKTTLRISNPPANIIRQIWKSEFLFIFSLPWLSLQQNFNIFLEKNELTSKVDDVAMSIHAQRAQLFAAHIFFSFSRKSFGGKNSWWRNTLQYIQGRVKVLVRFFFMFERRVYCFL